MDGARSSGACRRIRSMDGEWSSDIGSGWFLVVCWSPVIFPGFLVCFTRDSARTRSDPDAGEAVVQGAPLREVQAARSLCSAHLNASGRGAPASGAFRPMRVRLRHSQTGTVAVARSSASSVTPHARPQSNLAGPSLPSRLAIERAAWPPLRACTLSPCAFSRTHVRAQLVSPRVISSDRPAVPMLTSASMSLRGAVHELNSVLRSAGGDTRQSTPDICLA